MSENKIKKLNEQFEKGIQAYHSINCEKRTNVSLYLGNHYLKAQQALDRSLEKQGVDKSSRIRLTKNHIFKISEYMINTILNAGGDVGIFPANASELQDQKAAELHASVWEKYKRDRKFRKLVRRLVKDYVIDGEAVVKIFWNPNLGEIIREEQYQDENGEIKSKPIRSGDVEIERIYPWDLILPENVKELESSPWVGYQKMIPTKELKEMVPEEIKGKIQDTEDKTFQIFDPSSGQYQDRKGMSVLREKYTRPCEDHPYGYFEIFNEDVVIFEGELPKDHPFPIKVLGFTEIPTSPRSASIIRQLRPLQVRVNFGASQQALTQMTVGHDKLIMLGGANLQYIGNKRGVEQWKTNATSAPFYLDGRSGDQFVESMNSAISEMYRIANVPEQGEEKINQLDPQTALYRSMRDKQRFSLYSEKFIEFVQEITEDVLTLKKMYMDEEEVVRAVGRVERINISEFKNSEPIGYQITVNEVDEDASSKLGKHITLSNMLQYGGQIMNPEMIALIGRNMPFLNEEEIFQEQLLDYDSYKNIVLALDRGERVELQPHDNPDYLLPKLTSRTRKADFRFLPEEVKANYAYIVQSLQQIKAQQIQQLKAQQSQMVPTTGSLVPVPVYREVPKADGGVKHERVKLPYDAIQDLIAKLESQGVALDPVERMEQSTQAQIAQILNNQGAQPQPINNQPIAAS